MNKCMFCGLEFPTEELLEEHIELEHACDDLAYHYL